MRDRKENNEVERLFEENRKLLREVNALKKEISALKGKNRLSLHQSDVSLGRFEAQANAEVLFEKRLYLIYLLSTLRATSVFKVYSSLIAILRRYSFFTTSLKIAAYVITFLESSAIFVLAASFFVISFPITLLVSYITFILSFSASKRLTSRLKKRLKDKSITVFYPPRSNGFSRSEYFRFFATSFTGDLSHVIIVSPYFFSSKGVFGKGKNYFLAREENKNMTIIRKHYYFQFKKHILNKNHRVTEIY